MFQQLKEFFAEAKSEFKKISWPTPEEIQGSTAVVFVTILSLMVMLFVYDFVIQKLLQLVIK
ncbi:MAG TPA: preprotein translocase subunit SecE [bacterium]|nr:preprotein translocase subunit SecE [bacterium]